MAIVRHKQRFHSANIQVIRDRGEDKLIFRFSKKLSKLEMMLVTIIKKHASHWKVYCSDKGYFCIARDMTESERSFMSTRLETKRATGKDKKEWKA